MNKFLLNHSEKLTGYLLILPAVLIISLFGIFPVFFGMYMSVHKWKVFKGRFLGFENYQRILGDIPAFWLFVLGLLLLILSYGLWSEFKNKVKNKIYLVFLSIAILIIGIILININWEKMLLTGDEDYLYSLIYTFYYSFFTIIFEVGLGLIIAFALYQKLAGKQFFQMILLFPYITPAVMGAAVFFLIFGKADFQYLLFSGNIPAAPAITITAFFCFDFINFEEKLKISTKSSSLPLKNILNSGSFIICQCLIGLVKPGISLLPSPS